MSMTIDFDPHSHYMGFAIRRNNFFKSGETKVILPHAWSAFIDNGNTYLIDEFHADTLEGLKLGIRQYHTLRKNGYYERMILRKGSK